jgi:hypothetical protein
MKYLYLFTFALLFTAGLMAQPAVRGKVTLHSPAHGRDFIVRHTKVILATKTSRDTVAINDKLEFEFLNPAPGQAVLYLSSPVLPSHTEYKFRIKKKKPTSVSLEYDRFQTQPVKSPEEQADDVAKGLFIARLALDLVVFIQAVTR